MDSACIFTGDRMLESLLATDQTKKNNAERDYKM